MIVLHWHETDFKERKHQGGFKSDWISSDEVIPPQIPAAIMVPTGILLYILSLLTFVGNAMVLHAIRTDKRLQTVSTFNIGKGKSKLQFQL